MNKTLLALATLFLVFSGCSSSREAVDPSTIAALPNPPGQSIDPPEISQEPLQETWRAPERPIPYPVEYSPAFRRAVERGTRTMNGLPGANTWTNRADYQIEAVLDPAGKRLEGKARIRYTNNSPDALTAIHLELAQNAHASGAARMESGEVTGGVQLTRVVGGGQTLLAGTGSRPGYVVRGTQLILSPLSAIAPGQTFEMEIDWHFTIPQAGAGERMGYTTDESLFFLAYWFPKVAVYDDLEGWYTDNFLLGAEFYHGFGDYDLTLQVPEGWVVWSTGAFLNPEEVLLPEVVQRMQAAHASDTPRRIVEANTRATRPGALRYRFRAENVNDVAFSATRGYVWDGARATVADRNGDGQPEHVAINALWRPSAALWREAADYTRHSVEYISTFTDFPYPWPHMTSVEGASIIGGGMEFPMMTIIGSYQGRQPFQLYAVTVHEVAHMWVPMLAATNERRYSWIDEGMTLFHDDQATQVRFPGQDFSRQTVATYAMFAQRGERSPMMRRSDYHYTSLEFGMASYTKPAAAMVALRAILGEEVFMQGWRAFIREWAYKHPTPYDFWHTFERVSGQDLDWFWRTWYFETWTLDQAIGEVRAHGNEALVTVRDLARKPMPVHLVGTTQSGAVVEQWLPVTPWLEGRTSTQVRLVGDSPFVRIEIDPARNFPDVNRNNNVWQP